MATSTGASKLATLPEEILSNVASRLDSDDMSNLRISCRDVEAKVLHEFATQFIATKCFIVSSDSLQALASIASSTKLCHYLRQIYILTAHFPASRPECCSVLSTRQKRAYAAYATDQRALQDQGSDSKALVEAFKRLPSLRTLMLVDHVRLLPEDVQSHGLNTFRRKTGYTHLTTCPPPDDYGFSQDSNQTYYNWLSHVFRIMIVAVAESGRNSITRFGTNSISKSNLSRYSLSPLVDLNFPSSTVTKLTGAFANVEEVELQLRTLSLQPDKQNSPDDVARALRRVGKFTKAFRSNVTKLDLSLDGSARSGDVCTAIIKGIQLSRLTSLRLHGISIDHATLAKAVCELSSARDITFDGVDLSDGSWKIILHALEKLPSLDHLHIFYATAAGQKVYFLEQLDPDSASMADPMSAYLFGDPSTVDGGDADGQWQDTDDESDDEPPELLPLDHAVEGESSDSDSSSIVAQSSHTTEDEKVPERCRFYTGPDFKMPCAHAWERGYFVCLKGDEIHAQIPKLIKEHNVAGEDEFVDLFGGLLGAMPIVAPAAGIAANQNTTNPVGPQTLQTALTQVSGMFPGAGAAAPNGTAGWDPQSAPFPPGQFSQGLGPNGGLPPNPPASSSVLQGASGAAAQGQSVAGTVAGVSDQGGEVDDGAMDDVE